MKEEDLLWIAIRKYLWHHWTQQRAEGKNSFHRCELLSESIFDIIEHNLRPNALACCLVVNCYQKVSLTSLNTTLSGSWFRACMLWIAIRKYLWHHWTQPQQISKRVKPCCELLSESIFDIIEHNSIHERIATNWVVNCYQKVSLTSLNTTQTGFYRTVQELWIAIRKYLWHHWTQHSNRTGVDAMGCELLSESIFDIIEHNLEEFYRIAPGGCELLSESIFDIIEHNGLSKYSTCRDVVNCYQKVSLTSLNTTLHIRRC